MCCALLYVLRITNFSSTSERTFSSAGRYLQQQRHIQTLLKKIKFPSSPSSFIHSHTHVSLSVTFFHSLSLYFSISRSRSFSQFVVAVQGNIFFVQIQQLQLRFFVVCIVYAFILTHSRGYNFHRRRRLYDTSHNLFLSVSFA